MTGLKTLARDMSCVEVAAVAEVLAKLQRDLENVCRGYDVLLMPNSVKRKITVHTAGETADEQRRLELVVWIDLKARVEDEP